MRNFFKSKYHTLLGLDLSSAAVKLLEITGGGGKFSVENYQTVLLPENAMEGNTIKDADAVVASLKRLVSQGDLAAKQVALSVPDSAVITKIIQMNDGLNEQEIEEIIMSEADKYIPYPIEEINIDFNIIGPSAKNSAMLDVLVVASRTENVSARVDVVAQAGLEASIVDVESYALERAAQHMTTNLPAGGEKKNIAIIDIGAVYTHLFVLHGMKMIFSREEEFGGRQLIDTVMQQYKIPRTEASKIIESGPYPEDYVDTVLNPYNELILLQIKRALQFFFSTSNYNFVDHILLAGGVAKQTGIAQLIQEHINIPTSVANPFEQMQIGKGVDKDLLMRDAPQLLLACGLALRGTWMTS